MRAIPFIRQQETAHLDPEPDQSGEHPERQVELLTQLLRFVGALVLIAAASVFLVQNWARGDDISRYAMLLGFSGLMTIAGLLCGVGIRESKGARTLLGLVATIMPVHFAVLGGLFYSRFALDGVLTHYGTYTSWIAPSKAAAIVTPLCAVPVLAGFMYVAFWALAGEMAGRLTGLFLVCNLALLVPVRSADLVAWQVIILLVGLVFFGRKCLRQDVVMQTFEGYWVRGMLWLPVMVLLGRQYALYTGSALLSGGVWGSLALFLFVGARLCKENVRNILQAFSTFPTLVACFFFVCEVVDVFGLSLGWFLPLFAFFQGGALSVMSLYTSTPGAGYRRAAAIVGVSSLIGNLILLPGVGAAFASLFFGIVLLGYGVWSRQKVMLAMGALASVVGLGYHVRQAIYLYSWGNWGSLALFGLAIILAASFLEKNHLTLRQRMARLHEKFRE